MAAGAQPKKDFATRLSAETLSQLDELVRRGRFKTRTAAIEAAVARFYCDEEEAAREERMRKRAAFQRVRGVLHLGIDRDAWNEAEADRAEYELWKNTGRR
jgi:Arc/MetJ-type ribon-helix-helix transcriptional regulator